MLRVLLWLLTACGASAAAGQILAVPPTYGAVASKANAASTTAAKSPQTLLSTDANARVIALPAPTAAEIGTFKARNAARSAKPVTTKARRVGIGFARQVPAADQVLVLKGLAWQTVAGGERAARLVVQSPGASALRIGIDLAKAPAGLTLRFKGSNSDSVYGPYAAAAIGRDGLYWSPVLEGESATVELAVPGASSLDDATLGVPTISHLLASGAALKQTDPLGEIGQSGSCELDVACVSSTLRQQAATAINAVARVVLTDMGSTYLCSGTLLNDSIASATPYFYTANHCIDDDDNDAAASQGRPAAVAQTINTYWFFQTSTCGVHNAASVNFVLNASGTTLLGRSVDYDWALLKMNSAPPSGATFSAWNATGTVATGTAADGIHHPQGDLKKMSQGVVSGYHTYADGSSFISMIWSQGATEPGSSGSGLFTFNSAANYYELRGGLYGGDSSCGTPQGADQYSRLDLALPLLSQYLTPGAGSPTGTTPVVEFYNAALNDYFVTASPPEIGDLDNGAHRGWVRTGLRFLAYADPASAPSSASPVCRFYVAPAYGDSHFYSADPGECTATAQRFAAQWVYESPTVFYILLPDKASGACPSNSRPVYRFLNNANGLHHRYTAEVDVRDSIIQDGGWIQEGYGNPPGQVVMCSPNV